MRDTHTNTHYSTSPNWAWAPRSTPHQSFLHLTVTQRLRFKRGDTQGVAIWIQQVDGSKGVGFTLNESVDASSTEVAMQISKGVRTEGQPLLVLKRQPHILCFAFFTWLEHYR